MNKILFITNRNILTTSGELRLIKNRAEAAYDKFEIATDFIILQKRSRVISNNKEAINAGGCAFEYGVDIKRPIYSILQLIKFFVKLLFSLNSSKYDAIVLSGPATSFASLLCFSKNTKVIADIHGASEDILVLSSMSNIVKKIKSYIVFFLDYYSLKINGNRFDGCFVVTNELKQYVCDNFNMNANCKYFIVPCSIANESVDVLNYQSNRKYYREKYGIDENVIVFVYSGGISQWQCIDETIELYEKLKKDLTAESKMLFFSHNVGSIKDKYSFTDIIFDSFVPEELEKALCVGDYAFLLRSNCVTNNVAFPNKFLEYVKSGMKIITTPYLMDIANQVIKYDVGCLYDFNNYRNILSYINEHKTKDLQKDFLIRESLLCDNSFVKRLDGLNNFIEHR